MTQDENFVNQKNDIKGMEKNTSVVFTFII